MTLHGLSLIGGQPAPSSGAAAFGCDAVTGEPLSPAYVAAASADVNRAAELAAGAARDFGRRPGVERAAFLRRIAQGIEALGAELVERAVKETGLPTARIEGERARTCGQLRLFADVAESGAWADVRVDAADLLRKPQPRPEIRSLLRPLGPVVVFGASNFPLAFSVAGGDTAAALAAGCPVIVKAHSAHPGTAELVGRVIVEAAAAGGLPAGVFALLYGSGQEIGTALVRHPSVKAATFTGSRNGGMALWRAANNRPEPIPFFAEMSSVNPVFVFPEILRAKSEAMASGLHASMTQGVGQFCTQPGLIFVVRGAVTETWLANLAALVRQTPPGTMLTAGIQTGYNRELADRMKEAEVRCLARAEVPALRAAAVLLAVSGEEFLRNPHLASEVFGPCSLVVECASVEEFISCAKELEGQLTATLWGEPQELTAQPELLGVLEQKVGRLIVNGWPTGVEVGPAIVHGGPFPATTDSRFTSVGTRSILRFARPVAYQNFHPELLPAELRRPAAG